MLQAKPDEGDKQLVVWHLPEDGSNKNAYGRLMISNLEKLGVQVVPVAYSHLFGFVALRRKPDLIHFQSITPFLLPARPSQSVVRCLVKGPMFLLQVAFLRLIGCRIVWTVHNIANHELRLAGLERFFGILFARLANVLITHGEAAKRCVVETLRLRTRADKVVAIFHPNYIDAYNNEVTRQQARKELGIDNSSRVALVFGQIRPYKGLLELVTAYREVGQRGLELWIVGEAVDPELARLLDQAQRMEQGVHFHPGHVADDEIQLFLNACDVVVLPYRAILTSGAAALAMSFGRPCVVPRFDTLTEILDSKGAIFYDPIDPAGIRNALQKVWELSNDDLLRMGMHNLRKAGKMCWPRASRRFLAIYESIKNDHTVKANL